MNNTKGAFYAKWGLILGVGMTVFKCLVMTILGSLSLGFFMGLLYYAILIGVLYIILRKYSKDFLGQYPGFGKLFNTGFLVTLLGSIVTLVFMFVFLKYIINQDIIYSMQEMFYQSMSQFITEDTETAIEDVTRTFMGPMGLSISDTIGFLFEGAISTLIAAMFIYKKDPNPFSKVE